MVVAVWGGDFEFVFLFVWVGGEVAAHFFYGFTEWQIDASVVVDDCIVKRVLAKFFVVLFFKGGCDLTFFYSCVFFDYCSVFSSKCWYSGDAHECDECCGD